MTTSGFARRQQTTSNISITAQLIPEISATARNAEVYSGALVKPYSDLGFFFSKEQSRQIKQAIVDFETAATHLRCVLEKMS